MKVVTMERKPRLSSLQLGFRRLMPRAHRSCCFPLDSQFVAASEAPIT